MTDRIHAVTVVLEQPTRDDDAEATLNALRMVRGVLSVETHVYDVNTIAAEARAEQRWRDKIFGLLRSS